MEPKSSTIFLAAAMWSTIPSAWVPSMSEALSMPRGAALHPSLARETCSTPISTTRPPRSASSWTQINGSNSPRATTTPARTPTMHRMRQWPACQQARLQPGLSRAWYWQIKTRSRTPCWVLTMRTAISQAAPWRLNSITGIFIRALRPSMHEPFLCEAPTSISPCRTPMCSVVA